MEYPKNTMHYPSGAFRRMPQSPPDIAAQSIQRKNPCLEGASLAMVYSPCQNFEHLYEPMEALHRGTLYCRLDMPFTGNRR